MGAIIEKIFVAGSGGGEMLRVDSVEAVAGCGLRGDRYMERSGYWSGVDECQVTLIEGEGLDAIASETEIGVGDGEHRRNLVTRGVRLAELAGRRFSVGQALLEYDRPRPPCAYIQSITEPGMTRALTRGRGGICARVVRSGIIAAGDALVLVE